MLLKTKENISDILDDPTMSMKIIGLFFIATMCRKIHGLAQAAGQNHDEGESQRLLRFCPLVGLKDDSLTTRRAWETDHL